MDTSYLIPAEKPQHQSEIGPKDRVPKPEKLPTMNGGHRESLAVPYWAGNPATHSNGTTNGKAGGDRGREKREVKVQNNITYQTKPSSKPKRTLVLCFDGTGNKFHGDSSDSNILKIFRMLDRSAGVGFHYYQPGIGTYVSSTLSNEGSWSRLKNWYVKSKDSAVGTSFDQHVVGGYKFLMQHYQAGDDIYMFGFSRGSYTARFLSEMIDWVGLVTCGNEEMIQFAWRTFARWKSLDGEGEEGMKEQKKAYEFMVSFRETFSRPVRRIRYLGLFDTVNSVPRFENAMMKRALMPYSAKSSAKVIRHAVSIDERRAKFRSDLVSEEGRLKKQTDAARAAHLKDKKGRHERHRQWFHESQRYKPKTKPPQRRASQAVPKDPEKAAEGGSENENKVNFATPQYQDQIERKYRMGSVALQPQGRRGSRYRPHSRSRSRSTGGTRGSLDPGTERARSPSECSCTDSDESDEDVQDIDEVWFPGGHADIGGGWALDVGEVPLSHVPLVWIVREAQKAGLQFDEEKMAVLGCLDDCDHEEVVSMAMPTIEVTGSPNSRNGPDGSIQGYQQMKNEETFKGRIMKGATQGKIHDCLGFGKGLPHSSVLAWRIMEWLPFRRLDLLDDGSWKPIRWPLPRGEVRDMPDHAKVHHSAIKRMKHDPTYRPGNLILGGGGRGVAKAPEEAGIGEWICVDEEGHHVGEVYVRVRKESEKV